MNEKDKLDAVNALADKLPKTVSAADNVLSTVVNVFDIILTPFQIAKIYKDQKLEEIKNNIINKSKSIPVEDLKESADLSIVGPALEALKYTILNDDLNELFENLLVSSLDKRKEVFPGFVNIIKQLNSDEAKLLEKINQTGETSFPLIEVVYSFEEEHGYEPLFDHFSDLADGTCEKPELICAYLNDFNRLGLIEISTITSIVNEETYKKLEENPFVLKFKNETYSKKGMVKCNRHLFSITPYGSMFIEACVNCKD